MPTTNGNDYFFDVPLDFKNFLKETDQEPVALPPQITPKELLEFNTRKDPDELVGSRYLCRGGSLLIAAPTGIGKSSFSMQWAIHAAIGRELFGIHFNTPYKTAIIQAENDTGDMAEAFQGVFHTFAQGALGAEILTKEEIGLINQNLRFYRETAKTGPAFAAVLREIALKEKPDFVAVDPAFAFLGSDASCQKDVSLWLRTQLNPVLMETGICLIILHHSNKPLRGTANRDNWQGTDFAYLGAGSAEWANWARAVITIQRSDIPGIFFLTAAKRGGRLGWKDSEGKPATERFIAHAREDDRIYWREPDIAETREINRKAAQDGYFRLPEVFEEQERVQGLDADEIMARAVKAGITKSKHVRQLKNQWITGPRGKAVAAQILEKTTGDNYRPKYEKPIPY